MKDFSADRYSAECSDECKYITPYGKNAWRKGFVEGMKYQRLVQNMAYAIQSESIRKCGCEVCMSIKQQ